MKNKLSIPVFHGSFTGNIEEFHPCTHFGTREQATYRAIEKAMGSNLDEFYKKAKISKKSIFVYSCLIEFYPHECYEMEDWGASDCKTTLYHYLKKSRGEEYQKKIWRTHINLKDDEGEMIDISGASILKILDKHMLESQHKIISYANLVEFQGMSYMALYGDVVKITDIECLSLEEFKIYFQRYEDKLHKVYKGKRAYRMLQSKFKKDRLEFEDVFNQS